MLARPAAIKLIRPSLAGGGSAVAIHQFEREAQAIARQRSPHTVDLFDFGVSSDGAFYYAMELLEGLDADSFVKKFGPVPAERAIYFLRQVCHSLSEAQSCGLVHRDIKPANIFICKYGEERDFVKVLDFGIVRSVRDVRETGSIETRDNALQGTPAFMAPEQAIGHDLDSRADIYATGCLAYWLLTGKLVFSADTPVGMLIHHSQTPPSPPRRERICRFRPLSTGSSWSAWPRARLTARRPRVSCRGGLVPFPAPRRGPRSGRRCGGQL